jgi:hypothetical protein
VKLLNKAMSLVHPELHQLGMAGLEQLRKAPETADLAAEWTSVFTGVSVVVNRVTKPHRDRKAELPWYDLLVSLGTHQQAKLGLPELGLELHYPPGTAVAFCGNLFTHEVGNWGEGDRLCYAFFMRKAVLSRLGQEGSNWVPGNVYDE